MKTTISKAGEIKLVPEGTNDSFRLGLLVGGISNSKTKMSISRSPDKPNGELDFVELPLDALLDCVHRNILNK